jgi:hypothetical protein
MRPAQGQSNPSAQDRTSRENQKIIIFANQSSKNAQFCDDIFTPNCSSSSRLIPITMAVFLSSSKKCSPL